jgi:hypothetical protein
MNKKYILNANVLLHACNTGILWTTGIHNSQWHTEGGWGLTPPQKKSEVLTKLSLTPSSVEKHP